MFSFISGSLTLYHWQRLAQPHMASMLDVRPGVMVKGFRELERDPALYSMDDVEDDGQVCGKKSHKTLFVYFF